MLTSLLNKHAPQKSVTFSHRKTKPFLTPAILAAKSVRSKLETIFRRTRLPSDLNRFKNQSRLLAKLITASRRSFYRSLITRNKDQPRHLWATLNSLLSHKCSPSLPTGSFPLLISSFLKFFDKKFQNYAQPFLLVLPHQHLLISHPPSLLQHLINLHQPLLRKFKLPYYQPMIPPVLWISFPLLYSNPVFLPYSFQSQL